MFSAAQTPARR